MTTIGNIILFFAAIIFFGLQFIMFGRYGNQSKDVLLGYAWLSVLLNIAFLICMVVATIIIGYAGGFDWISERRVVRFPIIAFVLCTAMGVSLFGGVFRFETAYMPGILKWLFKVAPLIIPLVLLLSSAVLLNTNLRTSVSENLYKWPLIGIAVFGSLGIASLVYEYICEVNKESVRIQKSYIDDERLHYERKLGQIDSCDVTKDMVFILVFTDDTQLPAIRTRAVQKVKSNPAWESELIRLLNSDWAPEAFTFLGSNKPDHPAMFLEPVKTGILIQAKLISKTIKNGRGTYDFYTDIFTWEIERIIQALNNLDANSHGYLPEMKQLLDALRTHSPFLPKHMSAEKMLVKWIDNHLHNNGELKRRL